MSQKHTSTNGDPKVCMVVGCSRKAIYRNVQTNRAAKSHGRPDLQRGYCSLHRDFAVSKYDRPLRWLSE